jgi:hypothetical protein
MMLFVALCVFAWPQQAQAQYYCGGGTAYGISIITYDNTTHGVYAYSGTELDYCAGVYYDPYVEGYLYEGRLTEFLGDAVDSDYGYGYANVYPAEAFTSAHAKPSTRYIIKTYHYVVGYYYQYACYSAGCGNYWYDPWGYSFAGGDYGGGYNFWGYYNPGYYTRQYYYLGSTMTDLTTPYFCTGGNNGQSLGLFFSETGEVSSCPFPPSVASLNISGRPAVALSQGTAKPGGLPYVNTIKLTATATPSGGTYSWSSSSSKVELIAGANSPVVTVKAKTRSDATNDVTITVTYTPPGRSAITGTWPLTVQQPSYMQFESVVPGSNMVDEACADPKSREYIAGSTGWEKKVRWRVMSHLNTQMMADELPLTSTTNAYPGQNAGKFKGVLPSDKAVITNDGFWTHRYHWCSTRCGRGVFDAVRAFQRYVINGFTMPDIQNITFECNKIVVPGDGTSPSKPPAPRRRTAAQFAQDSWLAVLAVDTTDSERQYWTDRLNAAQAQGQAQLLDEARAFMRSLFLSQDYLNLNRSDEDYVDDLYWGYLHRGPDENGYNSWLSVLRSDNAQGINGREHLLQGFEYSQEFMNLIYSMEAPDPPAPSCDPVQEQNCYNQGGSWDPDSCFCTIIYEPPPDPCGGYGGYGYYCY